VNIAREFQILCFDIHTTYVVDGFFRLSETYVFTSSIKTIVQCSSFRQYKMKTDKDNELKFIWQRSGEAPQWWNDGRNIM
jgi:hypothetical protein